jgi:hypothetical protein
MSNQFGTTIYVDPNSDLGGMMQNMNKTEEQGIIDQCKSELALGKITTRQAINGLENFMRLWKLPNGQSSRTFYYIPNYVIELKATQNNTNDDNCNIT